MARSRRPAPGDALLRSDPAIRRHLRRAALCAPVAALLTVFQGFALAALVVTLAEAGQVQQTAAAVLIAATAARGALLWWLERAGRVAAAAAIARLRVKLVRDAATLAAASPGSLRAGEVAADVVHQLPAIESYVGRFLAQRPISVATTVIVLIAVASTDLLSAALLAPTVPLLIVFLWLVGSEAGEAADRRLQSLQLLGAHLLDVLRGLMDLRVFGRSHHQRSQVRLAAEAYRSETMATLRMAFMSGLVLELIAMLGTALVAVFGGVRLAEGIGELAAILPALVLAPQLYAPLRAIGAGYHDAADAQAALARLAEVAQQAGKAPLAGDPGARPAPRPGGAPLRLAGVSVAGGERGLRLDGVDLVIEPGSVTALTGPSGAGKTTLAHVILGILAPSQGEVRAGDEDLAACSLDDWRAHCAWVPQTPVLLPASLRENARLAAPRADDEQIAWALGHVGLGPLAAALPGGLDAPLGEDGARLSTGELRRLALARALLSDASLLILDEPTAQLDARSADLLRATLRELAGSRTVVLITHDPRLAAEADHVVQLGGGRVEQITRRRRRQTPAASREAARRSDSGGLRVLSAGDGPAGATLPAGGPATPAEAAGEPDPAAAPGVLAALRLLRGGSGRLVRRRLRQAMWLSAGSAISAVAVLALSGGLIVKAAEQPPVLTLTAVIVLVRMFSVIRATARYGERMASHDGALRLLADVRVRMLGHVSRHVPGRWSDRSSTALDHAVGDVDRSADLLIRVLVPGAGAVIAASLGVAVATLVEPSAGALIGAGVLVLGVAVTVLGRRAGLLQASTEAGRAMLGRTVVTALDAGTELLLAGRQEEQLRDVTAQSDRLELAAARHGARGSAITGLLQSGAAVLTVAVAVVLAGSVADGSLIGPLAAGLVLGALAIAESLEGLSDAALAAAPATAAVGRLAPALREEPAFSDGDAPIARTAKPISLRPELRIDGLVVSRGSRSILRGAGLQLRPGERVAISGENGAGKSTLLLAAVGLITTEAGHAMLNGVDVRELDERERAGHVTWAPSTPHLFGGSLAANLRLADPGASDSRLARALHAVGLGDWLAALPDGLETLVGENAARISGGQRQRIGLARAWLSAAPIVLLDEPASHLPEANAVAAVEAVLAAQEGRSALIVAHRASERTLADRELLLDGGILHEPARLEPLRAAVN